MGLMDLSGVDLEAKYNMIRFMERGKEQEHDVATQTDGGGLEIEKAKERVRVKISTVLSIVQSSANGVSLGEIVKRLGMGDGCDSSEVLRILTGMCEDFLVYTKNDQYFAL